MWGSSEVQASLPRFPAFTGHTAALACQLWGEARVNQTQPSGSSQLGVGEVRNPQPSWQGGLRGKGSPSQGPCRTLDRAPAGPWTAPSVHAQPPFRKLVSAQRPPRAAWTQPLPNTDWRVLSTRLQTKSRQLTSCSQDSNPAPVAGLCVRFTSPTEGPMGPVSSQCPSHTRAPTRAPMGTVCGNLDACEKHSCQGSAGLASTT